MADNLIFPIGFDLEKGVKDAQTQMDSVLRRLQKTVDGKPLTIPMSLDASKFTTFESALRGSIQHITDDAKNLKAALDSSLQTDNSANINRITEAMRNLEAAWKALPNNQKFDINDRLTPKAQEMVRQFNELATASSTYGQTLSQIAGKIKRVADEEAKANQKRNDGYAKLRKTLGAQENSIANLSAKIKAYQQILNSKEIGSKSFERVAEKIRKLTEQLDKAKAKVAELTGKAQSGAVRQSAAVRQVSQEFSKQDSYLTNLLKKTAALWSINQVGNFITQVREVTAQFELQRVSLGAILQDQNKANQLFSEIKSFALKSPVSILDLTKYTKQLAAYKIGYNELFETTKKLTDVSVGLGVSMDRVVLAYGQVRATGHLRASEVRQFTEMGVPIVEELAAKLSKMNGEMVTSAQVMDMISKRAISFDMVKEVFDDMTSAGGIFYNMQEKQGNTLYGLWAKLGDAASVMYSEIGNTGPVNDGMKSLISGLTSLMKNWRLVAGEAMVAVASFGAYKAIQALTVVSTEASTKATQRLMAAKNGLTASQNRLTAAQRLGNKAAIRHANLAMLEAQWTVKAATANRLAANATNVWTAAKYRLIAVTNQLKAAVAGNWIMLTVAAVAAIGVAIVGAIEKATRLKRALDDIEASTINLQNQSVGRFEHLAEAAVNAADGSKKQRDALAELSRTYGDILPQDALKLENLKRMNHNYAELTTPLKEYIAVQQKNKGMEEISNEYGGKINEASKKAIDSLVDYAGVERDVAINIVGEMQRDIQEKLEKGEVDFRTTGQKLQAAAAKFGVKISDSLAGFMTTSSWYDNWYDHIGLGKATNEFQALAEAVSGQYNELDEWNKRVDAATNTLGKFDDMQKRVSEAVANATYKTTGGKPIDPDKQGDLLDAMKLNVWVKQTAAEIQNNEDIKEAFAYMGEGIKSEWFSIINVLNSNDLGKVSQINFDAIIASVDSMIAKLGNKSPKILAILNTFRDHLVAQKKEYENMVPSDLVVNRWRSAWRTIASEVGISRQYMNRFLMQSGDDFEAYRKKIKEELTATINNLRVLQEAIAKTGVGKKMIPGMWRPGTDQFKNNEEYYKAQEAEKKAEALKKLLDELDKIELETGKKKKGSKGTKSDPRLQILQEMVSTLKQINKEYDDLANKEGATNALKGIQWVYADILNNMQELSEKYNFNLPKFDVPKNWEELVKYLEKIQDVMATLPESDKAVLSLKTEIGKIYIDEEQKIIERQLKDLQEKISRTKIAKEFYDKILAQTGDETLALQITYSMYPESGKDLYTEMQDQIHRVFDTGDALKNEKLKLRLGSVFDDKNERINYRELDKIYAEFQNDIKKGNRETAQKLIAEGQKTTAAQILNWEKELAKAKSYEEQRTDIINKAAEERAKIIKEVRDPKEQEKLLGLSREKESQDLAKVNFEEFTKSEDYVRIFENLDNVATSSLKHLREELQKVIDTNHNLSPENMKTLVKAMEDIDEQIGERNPWDSLVSSAKEYVDSIKNTKQAKQELATAEAEYKAQEPQLTADIETAKAEKETADEDVVEAERELLEIQNQRALLEAQGTTNALSLMALKDQEIAAENNLTSAKLRQEQAETNVTKAEQAQVNAQKKIANAQKKVDKSTNDAKKAQNGFTESLEKGSQKVADVQSLLQGFKDLLGDAAAEGTVIGSALEGGIKAMQQMQTIYGIIIALQTVYNALTESNPWMAIAAAVLAVAGILTGAISAAKVAEANREIEKQEKILDQLEYAYGRLEKAAEKVFGADYINNFNQRQKTLQAQAIAYQKQYQAELSKGKKADEEKLKEYKEKYRDTMDEIADMQGQVAERMLGTDLTSAARDFAQAWLDAYKEFGNTADAMSEKFHEMIENMVVESLLAKAMQRALEPTFTMIDKMNEEDFYDEDFWRKVMEKADKGSKDANAAGAVIMEWAKKWGYDGREKADGFTGIAKSVAGATSEEINNVAAIGNTVMYHTSFLPQIYQELVAMRTASLPTAAVSATSAGWTDWQQQAMDNYNAIARNTADTVIECRRAADACEKLARAVKTKGSTTGFNTFLNS